MVEKVCEPLTRFLFDSLKNKRAIDESFIAEVIEIVVNALGLNEYVIGYKINNKPWDGSAKVDVANYSIISRKITFELQTALEFYRYNNEDLRLNTFEKIAIIYDEVMSTLLHELEHPNQLLKAKSKDKDLEGKILEYSSPQIYAYQQFDMLVEKGCTEKSIHDLIIEKGKAAKMYYEYDPNERLAEYYSHKTMATILKELGTLPNISYYECLRLCCNYLIGYIDRIIPTKFFLEKVCDFPFWPEIEAASQNLDFESRASLGLPISEEEYEYLVSTTLELKRTIVK